MSQKKPQKPKARQYLLKKAMKYRKPETEAQKVYRTGRY